MKMSKTEAIAITLVVASITGMVGWVTLQEMQHQMQPDNLCKSEYGANWTATNNSTTQEGVYCTAPNGSVKNLGPINLSSELEESNGEVVDAWN